MFTFPLHLIVEPRIVSRAKISSKKRLLETLAELLVHDRPELDAGEVFERLLERERLGSTALGHGIALPHARMTHISDSLGALVQVHEPVDFDNQPVDLALALLVPQEATDLHLQLLSNLAAMFSDPILRNQLRTLEEPELLLLTLQRWKSST